MQRIASAKLQGELDRDIYHVSEQNQVTMPNWFDSQTSLFEGTTNEVHLAATNAVNGSGYDSPRINFLDPTHTCSPRRDNKQQTLDQTRYGTSRQDKTKRPIITW